MKRLFPVAAIAVLVACSAFSNEWKVGVQAYSFRKFTFCETLDQLSAMGVKYVEAYPGQKIGGGLEGETRHDMDAATRDALKNKLNDAGIAIISYGVVGGNSEDEWRSIFDFAKEMGVETVISEPNPDHYDLLSRLAGEYGIPVGIHNHAKPKNRYWDPQTVLDAAKAHPGLYAAPDNGHWTRSGIQSVDGFRLLAGQMKSLHLKDMSVFDDLKSKCVPYGTGICDLPTVIAELDRQGYTGPVIIEYESNPENPAPDIQKCVEWLKANTK